MFLVLFMIKWSIDCYCNIYFLIVCCNCNVCKMNIIFVYVFLVLNICIFEIKLMYFFFLLQLELFFYCICVLLEEI